MWIGRRAGRRLRGDLNSIDPGDVERIEIIRAPRAEELHGERARNGVVQIYLKKTVPPAP